MRGVSWDLTAEAVLGIEENGVLTKGNVRVDDPEIYKLQASRLTYLFEDEKMVSRSFRLPKKAELFSSALVSLFIRYGPPYMTDRKGKYAWWRLEDVNIELCITDYVYIIYQKNAPSEDPS